MKDQAYYCSHGNDFKSQANAAAKRIVGALNFPATHPLRPIERELINIKTSYEQCQTHRSIRRPHQIIKDLRAFIEYCDKQHRLCRTDVSVRLSKRLTRVDEQTVNLLTWHLAGYRWPNRKRHEVTPSMREELYRTHGSDLSTWKQAAEDALKSMQTRKWPRRGEARRESGWALDQVFILIGNYYQDLTGTKPSLTSEGSAGEPSGSFVEFAVIFLEFIGHPNTTPNAIKSRLKRVRADAGW